MKSSHLVLSVLAFLACSATVPATDLTRIDRTIVKEPAYKSKPKYCLLVFGQEAKTRMWLVVDGDVLYVDRNRNGNLTDKGESFQAQKNLWNIGEVMEADGKTKHTGLQIVDRNGSFRITMRTSEKTRSIISAGGSAMVQREGKTIIQGKIKIDPTKKPIQSEATYTQGELAGKTVLGIYEVAGDNMKICYALPGKDRPTEFSSKEGSGHVLIMYKRDKQ